MTSKVDTKTIDELNNMHIGSLMKRREALLKCEESFEASDRYGYETKPSIDSSGLIEFKDTPEWKRAYTDLKTVLSNRENIPSKKQRKEIRKQKAKQTI